MNSHVMTKGKDSGFTLIEVLAALLVFTIAITGLTHAGTQSAQAVTALDKKMLAGIVADNQIVVARRNQFIRSRRGEETQMSRPFVYDVQMSETESDTLYRVTVNVRDKNTGDDGQILVRRSAFFRPQGTGGL